MLLSYPEDSGAELPQLWWPGGGCSQAGLGQTAEALLRSGCGFRAWPGELSQLVGNCSGVRTELLHSRVTLPAVPL